MRHFIAALCALSLCLAGLGEADTARWWDTGVGVGTPVYGRTVWVQPPAPAAAWYRAGGAPAPIAVYGPKGADSYVESLVNLVDPGTFDATTGVAPPWGTNDGWACNGGSYLIAGFDTSDLGPHFTVIARLADISDTTANGYLIGYSSGGQAADRAWLSVRQAEKAVLAGSTGNYALSTVFATAGVVAGTSVTEIYWDGQS